jgi:hypothetical protein
MKLSKTAFKFLNLFVESVNSEFFELTHATPEQIQKWGIPEGSLKYSFVTDDEYGPPTFVIPDGDMWKDYFDGSSTYSASDPNQIGSCLAADDWLTLNAEVSDPNADLIGKQDESKPFTIPEGRSSVRPY